jgi:Protein of unknown function (DUF3769)
MVYPALEAATPPPLVQSFSAPVQASVVSPPSPTPRIQLDVNSLAVELPSEDVSTQASGLGNPLSISNDLPAQNDIRFSVIPNQSLSNAVASPPALTHFSTTRDRVAQLPVQSDAVSSSSAPSPKPVDLAPSTSPPKPKSNNSSFVELSADRQEYDTLQRAVTAVGNVVLNYRAAQLKADRVQTLAEQKRVIAEGNVQLTRGEQVLLGDRLEYLLDQERGILFKPRGIIYLPSTGQDFSKATPATNALGNNALGSEQAPSPQGTQTIQASEGIQRLRFEADRIEFTGTTWTAVNVRITNDVFSPPELELRADQAQSTRIAPKEDVVKLRRPRLVFDQNLSIPIPRSTIGLSRQRQDPFSVELGYDDRDRGGIFLGRSFTPISKRAFTFTITPQLLIQRAIAEKNFNLVDPNVYGLNLAFKSEFSSQTSLTGYSSISSLDFSKFSDNVRAGLRLRHLIRDYRLDFEAAYRERVINGSLEEQTIQNRFGVIFSSPTLQIGKTGVEFNYRLAGELITAETDVFGGLTTRSLGRLQGSASLQKGFDLWKGKTLPATATEGMKYTPQPLQPNLRVVAGLTGIVSGYTNGDSQSSLIGKIRLEGQFGHFSRPYLDYTSFFVSFSQGLQLGESPFLFDRFVDQQVVSAGFLQQIYGPVRLGVQSSINLSTGEFFNTDIVLDYSRRTYGLSLHYNPSLQSGALVFRINSFNWSNNRNPLSRPDVGVVEGGVGQTNDPF